MQNSYGVPVSREKAEGYRTNEHTTEVPYDGWTNGPCPSWCHALQADVWRIASFASSPRASNSVLSHDETTR